MKNKWVMFFILLVSAITVSLSQLKLSPVLGDVAAMLNVDITKAAMLMSLFTVAGIVLSIPGADPDGLPGGGQRAGCHEQQLRRGYALPHH